MHVDYLASYDRAFRKLPASIQDRTVEALDALLDYFQTGQRPHGLGLKRLHRRYWEIRVGLDLRVLFELGPNRLTVIFVGNHDDIRRWLRAS